MFLKLFESEEQSYKLNLQNSGSRFCSSLSKNSISENAGKRVVSGICLEIVRMEMNFLGDFFLKISERKH